VRVAIIAVLCGLLACCGPRPLPDWVVTRQVAPVAHVPARAARIVERPDRGPPSHVTPAQSQAELLPFTPEWQAREDAFDNRLRRTMNICRGC
jgi:hypothetical protein